MKSMGLSHHAATVFNFPDFRAAQRHMFVDNNHARQTFIHLFGGGLDKMGMIPECGGLLLHLGQYPDGDHHRILPAHQLHASRRWLDPEESSSPG